MVVNEHLYYPAYECDLFSLSLIYFKWSWYIPKAKGFQKFESFVFIDATINQPLSRQPRENTAKNVLKIYILLALMKIPLIFLISLIKKKKAVRRKEIYGSGRPDSLWEFKRVLALSGACVNEWQIRGCGKDFMKPLQVRRGGPAVQAVLLASINYSRFCIYSENRAA